MNKLRVLDLFSAAAGGWSLGMHRAGFRTMAACEAVAWRRTLYQENNPNVRIYDDVRTLTADRILRDCGFLPDIVVGSPPCQDISSANTKGKGVEGERSGLFFEAVRIIGEVRPRWFALENSANLRTRGADAVLAALEALGYACWAFVVGAGHVGANHERARSWLIGFDPEQISYPDGVGWDEGWERRRSGVNLSVPNAPIDPESVGHESRRPRGYGADGNSSPSIEQGHICKHGIRWPWACWECESETPYPPEERCHARAGFSRSEERHESEHVFGNAPGNGRATRWTRRRSIPASRLSVETCRDGLGPDAIEERLQGIAWRDEQGQREVAQHPDLSQGSEVGGGSGPGCDFAEPWADWNGGITRSLLLDDGVSLWLAGTRVAVGGPKGTSAASLIVEAFGDAVIPQIPEAIGRAMIRTEAALRAVLGRAA
jgi:DNA (cytosine-5)-methyltransferase 1